MSPADHPEPRHITAAHPESCEVLSVISRYSRSVLRFPSLVSSVRDAPLVSACAAGIPKPTHSSPPVPALISLSEALPMMGITLCCVWAAYTTTELPEVATSTVMSPEVAADAAEPLGVVTLAAVLSEAMALAAASSEVMAHAAESPEAAVLASAPSMVVAPSNVLSACWVAVKETVTELSLCPESTTVEPPEEAATAAEPPEVSVVSTCESLSCPVTAIEAACELPPCPVTAYELWSCPESSEEAAFELPVPSVTTEEAIGELPDCCVAN